MSPFNESPLFLDEAQYVGGGPSGRSMMMMTCSHVHMFTSSPSCVTCVFHVLMCDHKPIVLVFSRHQQLQHRDSRR